MPARIPKIKPPISSFHAVLEVILFKSKLRSFWRRDQKAKKNRRFPSLIHFAFIHREPKQLSLSLVRAFQFKSFKQILSTYKIQNGPRAFI